MTSTNTPYYDIIYHHLQMYLPSGPQSSKEGAPIMSRQSDHSYYNRKQTRRMYFYCFNCRYFQPLPTPKCIHSYKSPEDPTRVKPSSLCPLHPSKNNPSYQMPTIPILKQSKEIYRPQIIDAAPVLNISQQEIDEAIRQQDQEIYQNEYQQREDDLLAKITVPLKQLSRPGDASAEQPPKTQIFSSSSEQPLRAEHIKDNNDNN